MLGVDWADMNVKRRPLVVRGNAIPIYIDSLKSGHVVQKR
jgi:hypothetical protein